MLNTCKTNAQNRVRGAIPNLVQPIQASKTRIRTFLAKYKQKQRAQHIHRLELFSKIDSISTSFFGHICEGICTFTKIGEKCVFPKSRAYRAYILHGICPFERFSTKRPKQYFRAQMRMYNAFSSTQFDFFCQNSILDEKMIPASG